MYPSLGDRASRLLLSAGRAAVYPTPDRHDDSDQQLRSVTEIADSLVAVTTLLPHGNNPENYEPTPQAIQALASSAAYFYMGDLGFERSWVERIHTMQPALQLVRLDQDLVGPAHHHNGTLTDLHVSTLLDKCSRASVHG